MLRWKNGSASDLQIKVILGAQGKGAFSLQRFDATTGGYSLIGHRADSPLDNGSPVYLISAADLQHWPDDPLSLTLKVAAGNPAQSAMSVTLDCLQNGAGLRPEDELGAPVHQPVVLDPALPFNTETAYDFQVCFS